MNYIAFIYFSLTLLKLSYSKLSDQCTKSNKIWHSLKYPYIDILKLPTTQSVMFTCSHVSSQNCCSSDMNRDMSAVSELKLKVFAEEKIESILMMLSNDSYDLMNIYLKDLEDTKNNLNQLFSTTYGYNYKVHREFFFSWFDKLKLYMQGKLHNIGQLLDHFFLEMAQRIVRILIAPDSTAEVTACHTTRLIESKPYQDTDVLLRKKIVKSYPPARLLVNGIGVGRDVFKELLKNISPSSKCVEQFNTGFHCMICQGLALKSCSQTCKNVMDNCFGSFKSSDMKKLDKAFTKYIKILVQLATKLDNPFNFPEVNNKMNVQISTAIMNVQTMYPNVKEQIKAKCQGAGVGGSLPISRKRRQASQEFYKWQNANSNNNNNQNQKEWWEQKLSKNINEDNVEKKDFNNYQSKPNDALSPFAKKIKLKYKALENYFRNQRTEFCSSMSTPDVSVDCWNGTAVVKNTAQSTVKDTKKKNEKIEDPTIKSAIGQLNEIYKRINSYLTDVNTDPETVYVQEYKLYVSRKINKPSDNSPDNSQNQKIEGSGELDGNRLPQPNFKSEKTKEDAQVPSVSPPKPDKTNWELPTFTEGSGDNENTLPDGNINKTPKLPIKLSPPLNNSKTPSTVSSSTVSTTHITKPSTIAPNQLPDDEDLNPPENLPKVNVPVITTPTVPSVIQPEGSGNLPIIPDMSPNKPAILPVITTTAAPESPIDGSGDDIKPKTPTEKPPILPMLPDASKSVTGVPKLIDPKPDVNPDEEKVPIEGSGGRSPDEPPIRPPIVDQPPIVPVVPQVTTAPEPTKPPTEPLAPEQYPGKVPPEVWLPGLEGVNNQAKNTDHTSPSGWATTISSNKWQTALYRTMLSLFMLRALL